MKKESGRIIFSPSDLIRFMASPFASWMDHYFLENPAALTPDEDTPEQRLVQQMGHDHEKAILQQFKAEGIAVVEIDQADHEATLKQLQAKAPLIYQAQLSDDRFAGYADFLILNAAEAYEVWDTKLARLPKPYYALQLCCYAEMLAKTSSIPLTESVGVILGTSERVLFRVEDFIHYYRNVRAQFLAMHDVFTGNLAERPEPLPSADHGRWTSYAEKFFDEQDHLVRVAGISVGQIKKLKAAGISTMDQLASRAGSVPKLAADSLASLTAQARLQCATRAARKSDSAALARYEILSASGTNGEPVGLAILPPADPADVFFDMEGYPLVPGGLEYLFGVGSTDPATQGFQFQDWWAHTREQEKFAFEGFIDWVHDRWKKNAQMHIYHYAAYEVNAISRLSTRHDTRQNEVDDLLRANAFIDLYKVVRQGIRIGEQSYSIKVVEQLYRRKRATDVTSGVDSIVQYAQWTSSNQPQKWDDSPVLQGIREYNADDCRSTMELTQWLRNIVAEQKIKFVPPRRSSKAGTKEVPPEVILRHQTIDALRECTDPISLGLANLLDFHRREEKPMWWRKFDRLDAYAEDLRDDSGCIEGVVAVGVPRTEKLSFVQGYRFDPAQECKLSPGPRSHVMFTHNADAKFTLFALDFEKGTLELKISKKALTENFSGAFPQRGSLIPDEYVGAEPMQNALTALGQQQIANQLNPSVSALLQRTIPTVQFQSDKESTEAAAIRIVLAMNGGCLVVQGPPGTGKTYIGAQMIFSLLEAGKRVAVTSNSHKAIFTLLSECGKTARKKNKLLQGMKVGSDPQDQCLRDNPQLQYVATAKEAISSYRGGVVGGTAWLFSLPEWEGAVDYLFVDEAGQVSLANAAAMARCTKNIILLGDQMQLEQPIQGTHPGDAGLSTLQYALKDLAVSREDAPIFHAVVPRDVGLFLGESRRMHPAVCKFVSDLIYEGRLTSHPDCDIQRIALQAGVSSAVKKENGVVFVGVEHDGNIQQSDEEVAVVKSLLNELLGRTFTDSEGKTKPLALEDFLFIAPYNAQVRTLQAALPSGAKVGSVDRFQGQQAPVCIISLCSSYGEYGSRGLGFILDRNRINVALSRARCLAIVVADPRIASAAANSINEMKLLNVFCKIAAA